MTPRKETKENTDRERSDSCGMCVVLTGAEDSPETYSVAL